MTLHPSTPPESVVEPSPFQVGRTAVRLEPCKAASCQLSSLPGNDISGATLENLSGQGVGLIVEQTIPAGGFLFVEITNASGLFSRVQLTRVAHVSARAEGGFLVGGEFVNEMSEEEVRMLLG